MLSGCTFLPWLFVSIDDVIVDGVVGILGSGRGSKGKVQLILTVRVVG